MAKVLFSRPVVHVKVLVMNRPTLALCALLSLPGCIVFPLPVPSPQVAQQAGGSTASFNAALQSEYGTSLTEAELAVRLLGDGFSVNATAQTAQFQHALAICGRQYLVGWAADAGQVTAIQGEVVGGCN